jgi:hypothetical protein
MKRIKDTNLVILDQTWDSTFTTKYVGIKDLIEFLNEGMNRANKTRKPFHKEYLKGYKRAISQMITKMNDLISHETETVNIPNRFITR